MRLAEKPQPRARGRPQLPSSAGQPGSSGEDLDRISSGNEAGPSGRGAAACVPPLRREREPLGLEVKTAVVRATRKLQEQAAQLSHLIPNARSPSLAPLRSDASGAASGRTEGFIPRLPERTPQLRHAQRTRRRKLKGVPSGYDTNAGDGADDPDSQGDEATDGGDPLPTGAPATGGGRLYGRPPLRNAPAPLAAAFSSPPLDVPAVEAAAAPAPGLRAATGTVAASASHAAAAEDEFREPRPSRLEFEKLVLATTDLQGLRALYDKYCDMLSCQQFVQVIDHVATMSEPMNMSVKVWAATQGFLVELLQRITPNLDSLSMMEFAHVLSAVAKLRYVPPNDWIAAVLTQSKTRLYNATPAYLTSTLRALSRIALDPSDVKEAAAWESWMKRYLTSVQRQLSAYRADELVKTLVALSELRYRPPAEWMARFSAALHTGLDSLEAHALSEAMLAFAALSYQPEGPFLRAYYSHLHSRLPLADDRDLATYAQAAALLERLVRQEFMHEFLAEVLQKLPTFKPAHLANLLSAMGRLASQPAPRVRPPPGWTAAVAEHLSAKNRVSGFNGSSLASAAWGLSALGHTATPKFLDDLLSASYGKMHTCGPTDLVLLLTALGNFGYRPLPGREAFWDTWMTEFEKLAARKSFDTRGVCDLMTALARLPRPVTPPAGTGSNSARSVPAAGDGDAAAGGAQLVERPPHEEFVRGVLRSTRMHNLRNTSPARLAGLAGALASMGIKPDFGFLYNYGQAARFMWASFSMRDYATLLGAMVHIGTPGIADPRWAGDFLAIIMCRMSEFDGPGLAAALDALRYLPKPEFEPSRQWLQAAALRAVELVRPPPPPPQQPPQQQTAASTADMEAASPPLAPAPAPPSSTTEVQRSYAPLAFRPGELQGGVTLVTTPQGRMVPVQPQEPMTPELLLLTARALAALGHRMQPGDPLAGLLRSLLQRNSLLLQLQTPSGAAAVMAAAADAAAQAKAQPAHSIGGGAAAAAAFEHASALAAAVLSGGEIPRPLLSDAAAAEMEGLLASMLGMTPAQAEEAAEAEAEAEAAAQADEEAAVAGAVAAAEEAGVAGVNAAVVAGADVAAATAPLLGLALPGGMERSPEQLARAQAYWEAKLARRARVQPPEAEAEASGAEPKAPEAQQPAPQAEPAKSEGQEVRPAPRGRASGKRRGVTVKAGVPRKARAAAGTDAKEASPAAAAV